jgi:hypothetical protein
MDTQQISAPPRAPSRVRRGTTPSSGVVHSNSRHSCRFTVVGNHLAQHRALLRRRDPPLLLSGRDIRRLAPAVAAWLERGVGSPFVGRTLTTGLPEPLTHPVGLLAHRLTELLPPPLPMTPAADPVRRPDPLQNCDRCDRAFRAPAPGPCHGCRADVRPTDPLPRDVQQTAA